MDPIQDSVYAYERDQTTPDRLDQDLRSDTPNQLAKRRRTHTKEELCAPYELDWADLELIRCEELWFDDGNIVIRVLAKPYAPDLPPTLAAFKCHRSVLASKSDFFRTMFQLPQDAAGQPTMDGVPCVDFMDDFEGLRDLLKFMYGLSGMSFIVNWPSPGQEYDPIPEFSRILKVAIKYDVQEAMDVAYALLGHTWPKTWRIFMAKEAWMRRVATDEMSNPLQNWVNPARVLLFAEEFHITDIMCAAWYDIARSSLSGASVFDPQNRTSIRRRTVDLSLLSEDHIRRLAVGHERLRDILTEHIDGLNFYIQRHKKRGIAAGTLCECFRELEALWERAMIGARLLDLTRDPLGEFAKLAEHVWNISVLQRDCPNEGCTCCHVWLDGRLRGMEKEIWELLPEVFDFKL